MGPDQSSHREPEILARVDQRNEVRSEGPPGPAAEPPSSQRGGPIDLSAVAQRARAFADSLNTPPSLIETELEQWQHFRVPFRTIEPIANTLQVAARMKIPPHAALSALRLFPWADAFAPDQVLVKHLVVLASGLHDLGEAALIPAGAGECLADFVSELVVQTLPFPLFLALFSSAIHDVKVSGEPLRSAHLYPYREFSARMRLVEIHPEDEALICRVLEISRCPNRIVEPCLAPLANVVESWMQSRSRRQDAMKAPPHVWRPLVQSWIEKAASPRVGALPDLLSGIAGVIAAQPTAPEREFLSELVAHSIQHGWRYDGLFRAFSRIIDSVAEMDEFWERNEDLEPKDISKHRQGRKLSFDEFANAVRDMMGRGIPPQRSLPALGFLATHVVPPGSHLRIRCLEGALTKGLWCNSQQVTKVSRMLLSLELENATPPLMDIFIDAVAHASSNTITSLELLSGRLRELALDRSFCRRRGFTIWSPPYLSIYRLAGVTAREYSTPTEQDRELRTGTTDIFVLKRRLWNVHEGFEADKIHARRPPNGDQSIMARCGAALGKVHFVNALDIRRFPGRGFSVSGIDPRKIFGVDTSIRDPLAVYRRAWPHLAQALTDIGFATIIFCRGAIVINIAKDDRLRLWTKQNGGPTDDSPHYSLVVYNDHFHNAGYLAQAVPTKLLAACFKNTLIDAADYTGPSVALDDINRKNLSPQMLQELGARLGTPVIDLSDPRAHFLGFTRTLPLTTIAHGEEVLQELKGPPREEVQRYLELLKEWEHGQLSGHRGSRGRELDALRERVAIHFDRARVTRWKRSFEEGTQRLVSRHLDVLDLYRVLEVYWQKGLIDDPEHGLRMVREAYSFHQARLMGEKDPSKFPVLAAVPTLDIAADPTQDLFVLDTFNMRGRFRGQPFQMAELAEGPSAADEVYYLQEVLGSRLSGRLSLLMDTNVALRFFDRNRFAELP